MSDTPIPGVDYSSGRPGGAALAKAGIRFAARYLSHTEGKNLTPAEAADLAAHGVSCVVVWETTANRAGAGRNAGVADAQEAAAQAKACGQPAGRPIFFAVDWDASPSVVVAYFQGVASVLGLPRTGVYGGYRVVKYLLDHSLARWAWQTAAWSEGQWDARAVLRQPATTTRIAGVSCDRDTATAADYGQWMPGRSPDLEEDVPLTDAEVDKVATATAKKMLAAMGAPAGALAAIDNPTVADNPKAPAADDESVRALWWDTGMHAGRADANSKQAVALLGSLTAVVAKLAAGGGLTAEQIQAAGEAGADAALAKLGETLTNPPKEN